MTWRAVFAGGNLAPDAERRVLDALRRCWDEVTGHDSDVQANVYTEHHGDGAVADVTDAGNHAPPTGEAANTETAPAAGAPAEQATAEAVPGTAQAPQEAVDAGTVAVDQPGGTAS